MTCIRSHRVLLCAGLLALGACSNSSAPAATGAASEFPNEPALDVDQATLDAALHCTDFTHPDKSAVLLVHLIVVGQASDAGRLLLDGVAVWSANVIVFSLWYWQFDRGGPVARAHAERRYPDLLFPQMQQDAVAPRDWEPTFFDYLYTSFTNATAFSPTDTMPLSRWAKAMFLLQSAISLVTVALVISRAVNIFQDVTQK